MPLDLVGLKAELDTDPLGRGYSGMSDAVAADDLSAVTRPAEGGVGDMLNYCIINRSKTNNGTDTVALPILGRLVLVAEAAIDADPFGTGVVANQVDLEMKTWAKTFLHLFNSPYVSTLNFVDTEVDAGFTALGPGAGVVWKNPDINALKAFSQNLQSRVQELQLGRNRVIAGDVAAARAL